LKITELSHSKSLNFYLPTIGKLGIQLSNEYIFDVIFLDLNLPDMDGLEVYAIIKKQAQVSPYIDVNRKR
jgi:CheY-like chemotaxis protein